MFAVILLSFIFLLHTQYEKGHAKEWGCTSLQDSSGHQLLLENQVLSMAYYQLRLINQLQPNLEKTLTLVIHAFVTSNLDYCEWSLCGAALEDNKEIATCAKFTHLFCIWEKNNQIITLASNVFHAQFKV